MTGTPLSPFALELLRRLVPQRWRDSIEGDLIEECGRRREAGQPAGWIWQSFAVLMLGVRLAKESRKTTKPFFPTNAARSTADALRSDVYSTVRGLLANPGYALLAVAVLTLGIGANASILDLANWLIFRPVPGVDRPSDLVAVRLGTDSADSTSPLSVEEVQRIAATVPTLDGVTGFVGVPQRVNVDIPRQSPRRLAVEFVMGNYFEVLHARIDGHTFSRDDGPIEGSPAPIVISDAFRQELLSTDAVLGRVLRVNAHTVTIVGVTPRGFRGTRLMNPVDIWMPVSQRYLALPAGLPHPARDSPRLHALFSLVGRVAQGQSLDRVESQLGVTRTRLAAEAPSDARFKNRRFHVVPHLEFYADARARLRQVFQLLLAGAVLLLALACANVSNVILARTMTRRGEIAIRLAIGGTRGQVGRLLLIESLLLSCTAAIVALAGTRLIAAAVEGTVIVPTMPPLDRAVLDWRVISVSIAIATLAAVASGLSPMWSVGRINLVAALQAASRLASAHSRRLRQSLMTIQVGISVVLLICGALLLRSIHARLAVDPGFDAARVRTFRLDPRLPPSEATSTVLYRDLVDRIRQIPEVRAASVAFLPPFSSDTETRLQFRAESSPTDLAAGLNSVRAGFFDTLGISFVAGRDFTQTELDSPEPATQGPIILPESIAHRIFGTSDIVGRSVVTSTGIRRPVVGVIRDSRQRQLTSADAADEVFQPYRPNYKTPFVTVIVSIAAPTIEIWPELRRALADIDPSLTMFDERRGDEGIRMEFGQEILAMRVALVFGVLAVMLAAAGLYATLFRSLAERRREYGIRVALGATPTQLVGLVTHEAGAVLLVGVGTGALVSVWLTRFLSSWLYGITPLDGSSFAGAALLVTLVMFLASLPACGRVARVNAAATLRE